MVDMDDSNVGISGALSQVQDGKGSVILNFRETLPRKKLLRYEESATGNC